MHRALQNFAETDAATARRSQPLPHRLRPLAFSPFLYRYRYLVERFFSRLKHYRAIAPDTKSAPPTISLSLSSPQSHLVDGIMKQCPSRLLKKLRFCAAAEGVRAMPLTYPADIQGAWPGTRSPIGRPISL